MDSPLHEALSEFSKTKCDNQVWGWPCVKGKKQAYQCSPFQPLSNPRSEKVWKTEMWRRKQKVQLLKHVGNFLEGQERAHVAKLGVWPSQMLGHWAKAVQDGFQFPQSALPAWQDVLGVIFLVSWWGWSGEGGSLLVGRDQNRQKWGSRSGRQRYKVASRTWSHFGIKNIIG